LINGIHGNKNGHLKSYYGKHKNPEILALKVTGKKVHCEKIMTKLIETILKETKILKSNPHWAVAFMMVMRILNIFKKTDQTYNQSMKKHFYHCIQKQQGKG
jgi:hypothetical protein